MNRKLIALLAVLPLAAIVSIAGPASSAETASKPKVDYLGSSNCQRCHFNPIQQDLDEGRTAFIAMNESHIWSTSDRHSKAFTLLQCERGQEIGRRLGWNVTSDQRCLSCHANWQLERAKPEDAVLAEGVACEACHGPSSKYMFEHTGAKWRSMPFHQRSDEFGMTLLRDPQVCADVCLACHIGNAEQGKVITHEMYAAGHPPLPSFELRNFGEMIKHWSDVPVQLANMKANPPPPRADESRRDLQFIQSQLGEDSSTVPALKTALYGGVMTLRQSIQLLADEAGSGIHQAQDVGRQAHTSWPEFALFDCAMCHHDLQYPAWRQTQATLAPGRPQTPRWPQALVAIAIDQVAGGDQTAGDKMKQEFARLTADLEEPFRRQPFGNPVAIAEPAMKLVAFLDRLLAQMKPLKFDGKAAHLASVELCDAALNGTPDYDSARQLAWALESINNNLNQLHAAEQAVQKDASSDRIARELEALHAELRLSLNPLRADGKDVCSQAIGESDLRSAMESAAAYSPEKVQQHFRMLRELLTASSD